MPKNKLQKTLHDYLTKIKHPPHPQIHLPRILSGCKHPKTPSFALDGRNNRSSDHAVSNTNNQKDDAATLADVDRFLFENFKSLYFKDDDETQTNNKNKNNNNRRISKDNNNDDDDDDGEHEPPKLASLLFDSPRFLMETPTDLCNAARFFVKPGNSGSLMEDSVSTLTNTSDEGESSNSNSSSLSPVANHNQDHRTLPDNCVALLRYSPTPYDDFRRSMQDVVESKYGNINNNKNINNDHIDWDFMEDLLFCYLNLNEKKSHKFILSAFVDLITLMRRNSETSLPKGPCSVRTVRIDREVSEKKKKKNMKKKKTKQLTIEFGSP